MIKGSESKKQWKAEWNAKINIQWSSEKGKINQEPSSRNLIEGSDELQINNQEKRIREEAWIWMLTISSTMFSYFMYGFTNFSQQPNGNDAATAYIRKLDREAEDPAKPCSNQKRWRSQEVLETALLTTKPQIRGRHVETWSLVIYTGMPCDSLCTC